MEHGGSPSVTDTTALLGEVYNIIPVHDSLADHPSLRLPEVRAVITAFREVRGLRRPPFIGWKPHYDLLDWLAIFFGFQSSNVSNQREHIVLHLSNAQMRLSPPPDAIDALDPSVLSRFRRRLLKNYSDWCSYLNVASNIWLYDDSSNLRRELLYVSLYLLIWGESANLRFMPECICFIFHNMAVELNKILENYIDENTGMPSVTSFSGDNGYLNRVVKPIYDMIKSEVDNNRNKKAPNFARQMCDDTNDSITEVEDYGMAPYSSWRNYDDINEYFWSQHCIKKLEWPINVESNFFVSGNRGKRGFVEQRSFWNVFRSFHRLWVMLILFLQVAIIVAWEERQYPWLALESREVNVRCLTVFFTWSAMNFLLSMLDGAMQHTLVSRETLLLGVKMVLKVVTAAVWTLLFGYLYWRIWEQMNSDGGWSSKVNKRVQKFLKFAFVYMATELLTSVLFFLPCLGSFFENWKIFYPISWWLHTRTFVGQGLQEGLMAKTKYTIFWIAILATKFSFSYFLQIKPMIGPTKTLLRQKDVEVKWHQFFHHSDRLAVGLPWLPVVLIYLMDIQIWYSIYSSFLGSIIALFLHLGEIRNMRQLRLRFQFFASALQFNLMPEKQLMNARGSLRNKMKNAIRWLKLRRGFSRPFRKLETNQVEAYKLALIWNEIINIFREEDIVSDREVELLEMSQNDSQDPKCDWEIRVIQWPALLLCNELLLALSQAKELVDAPDKWLWYKICKTEYRRCAVIEAYDSLRHFLLAIVKYDSEECSIIQTFFVEIDQWVQRGKFTKNYKITALHRIHEKLVHLLNLVLKPNKDVDDNVVNALQALYEAAIREFLKEQRSIDRLKEDGLAPQRTCPGDGLLFENAVELPSASNDKFYRQVRRLHTILTTRDSMQKIPENLDARRRLAFFSNSLFMNMPHAPQVEKMMAFSVLTPYHNETVLYSKEQLRTENEDGISTIYYLQTIYANDWRNFLERMRREGMVSERELWTNRLRDLRLWASYRGQTLARTVRGMMYYSRALEMLDFLDSVSEMDMKEVSQVGSMGPINDMDGSSLEKSPSSRNSRQANSSVNFFFEGHYHGTALMKFTHVVACQLYGSREVEHDSRAEDIHDLMKYNEALRVAFVDEVSIERNKKEYYSVLVKFDPELQREVEIYRIKLPGNLDIGEGKAENQNHALIFTRGDALQTIDMNQDNYFEEALKMRNLLEEFNFHHGIRKPTILGVREHIFSGPVSSPAQFMCAQETSFVTLGQRIMANPLKVRMHYGHPDVFDRFWFLTRGGISKGSRILNINEDIFAGFNCTLRKGNVTHHEYIQFGKGRDVGLNEISTFEAKIARGSAEQILSRDVYRLGTRLDFFRMLSLFHTSVGFFFNAWMVVFAFYTYWWGRLYLALSGVESFFSGQTDENAALLSILSQEFIISLGIFVFLPMIVESTVENGFLVSVWEFTIAYFQLAPVFYTISFGTRAHHFGQTLLHGGAKYQGTGRGFAIQHQSFVKNYTLYARSHFYKAIELGLIITVYSIYSPMLGGTFVYLGLTLLGWFLVVSWIMGPFIFNPLSFDLLKTVNDFYDFKSWIWSRKGAYKKPDKSPEWEVWWDKEQDHLRRTGLLGKIVEIILNFRFFFFHYGIVYHLDIAAGSKGLSVYGLSWIYVAIAAGFYSVLAYERFAYYAKSHFYYRLVQFLAVILAIIMIVALLYFTKFTIFDLFTSQLAFLPVGWGLISIGIVLRPLLEKKTVIWDSVVLAARLYEMMFGIIVITPVAILSWLPGIQAMQNRILFNEAFSRGLHISQILTAKKHV